MISLFLAYSVSFREQDITLFVLILLFLLRAAVAEAVFVGFRFTLISDNTLRLVQHYNKMQIDITLTIQNIN